MINKRKIVIMATVVALAICGSGCNQIKKSLSSSNNSSENSASSVNSAAQISSNGFAENSLTGLFDVSAEKLNNRPVAVMINNIKVAWQVQTGVINADVVYEMEVEGGITRMMAVYKDIASAPQIGSVRSARYNYADVAMGFDAVYMHCGKDKLYCVPHMNSIGVTEYDLLDTGASAGFRSNPRGLASEHTMFTTGAKIDTFLNSKKIRRTTTKTSNWLDFLPATTKFLPTDGGCQTAVINFSDSYFSTFKYDSATGNYLKYHSGTPHTDYKTGKQLAFKNVFVLYANVALMADGYHVKADLTSGKGVYISNGAYENITWKKGSASNEFSFNNSDGSALKPNAGKSYIAVQNETRKAVIS